MEGWSGESLRIFDMCIFPYVKLYCPIYIDCTTSGGKVTLDFLEIKKNYLWNHSTCENVPIVPTILFWEIEGTGWLLVLYRIIYEESYKRIKVYLVSSDLPSKFKTIPLENVT